MSLTLLQKNGFFNKQRYNISDNVLEVDRRSFFSSGQYNIPLEHIDPEYFTEKVNDSKSLTCFLCSLGVAVYTIAEMISVRNKVKIIPLAYIFLFCVIVFCVYSFIKYRLNSKERIFFVDLHNGQIRVALYKNSPDYQTVISFANTLKSICANKVKEFVNPNGLAHEILSLEKLMKNGIINMTEFVAAKKKLLDIGGDSWQ